MKQVFSKVREFCKRNAFEITGVVLTMLFAYGSGCLGFWIGRNQGIVIGTDFGAKLTHSMLAHGKQEEV